MIMFHYIILYLGRPERDFLIDLEEAFMCECLWRGPHDREL